MRLRRLATVSTATLALAALTLVAGAQQAEPTLHIYVAPPTGRIVAPQGAPGVVGGGAGQNPTAIRQGPKLLPEPSTQASPAGGETVFGTGEFGADRQTHETPDRQTEEDGGLSYVEVFNPSVVPFKRMSVLDGIRDDFALTVHNRAQRDKLVVGAQTSPDRDLFWASLLIDVNPGQDVAIPSVAPDMGILSYETTPAMRLEFSKDSADNYYVSAEDPAARGRIRLVFLADAPATYFAAAVPKGKSVRDLAGSDLLRPVPANVAQSAQIMLDHLGLSKSTPLDVALDSLVSYFRGFDAGPPPAANPGGNIYLDLTLSKRGVCRHRAFAFMVTANALGIPARFVANEAHAFVEVWVPELEWLRIDLGGEALRLDVSNASGKTMHRPRRPDPFPKPPGYGEDYARLEGDVRGLTQQQLDEARAPTDPTGGGAGGPGSGQGTGTGTLATDPNDPLSPAPGKGLPAAPQGAFPGKTDTTIRVTSVDEVGYRGESVRVHGRVESSGAPVGGVRVDVWFAPAGESGDGARFVGQSVSNPDGTFSIPVELPGELPLGRHEVFASTPGDGKYAPSLSK